MARLPAATPRWFHTITPVVAAPEQLLIGGAVQCRAEWGESSLDPRPRSRPGSPHHTGPPLLIYWFQTGAENTMRQLRDLSALIRLVLGQSGENVAGCRSIVRRRRAPGAARHSRECQGKAFILNKQHLRTCQLPDHQSAGQKNSSPVQPTSSGSAQHKIKDSGLDLYCMRYRPLR